MWPRSADHLYPGLDPSASDRNESNFEFYYIRMLERIGAALENWIGLELEVEHMLFTAALISNDHEDPLWSDLGRGYGSGQSRKARDCLRKASVKLAAAAKQKNSKRAQEMWEEACNLAISLGTPVSILVKEAMKHETDTVTRVIDELREIFDVEVKRAGQRTGKVRARRVALRLRAIVEFYTDHEITAGPDPEIAIGRYPECLAELYEVIGIDMHFYRPALHAAKCANDEDDLRIGREGLKMYYDQLDRWYP
ncbi:hypothetical protein [Palleronia sp.]|uniref:hypothetical protein n=1 Tax=Palleronia sp. TaxID=1940284 RepID=UPI0035C80D78